MPIRRVLGAVLVALLSTGCSSAGDPIPTSDALDQLKSQTDIEAEFDLFFDGRHPAGTPRWRPESEGGTEELRMALQEEVLTFAVTNPVPRDTIYGGTAFKQWHVACAKALGMDVSLNTDGSISGTVGSDPARDDLVMDLCRLYQVFSGATPLSTAFDTTAITDLYRRYVATYDCLKDSGFAVDEPPSLDSFLQSLDYYPYSASGAAGPTGFGLEDLGMASKAEMEAMAAQYPGDTELIRAMWTCPIAVPG